jgi:aminobenzoyl-glutamate transport protein
MAETQTSAVPLPRTRMQRFLDGLEAVGNKLPDPAMIFVIALAITWIISAVLANVASKMPTRAP